MSSPASYPGFVLLLHALVLVMLGCGPGYAADFHSDIRPLLDQYCLKCHGGEKVKGEVDFGQIQSDGDVDKHFELWETVADVLAYGDMPPEEEEERPSESEAQRIIQWYENQFVRTIEAKPAEFRPRRLSAPEYRNTLRSVLGLDLQVAFIEAEQTTMEPSLALKLLPTDPPGKSGYINDSHGARLSSAIWEQYAYLADRGLQALFSGDETQALESLVGKPLPNNFVPADLTESQAGDLLKTFARRVYRRPVARPTLETLLSSLRGLEGEALLEAVKEEMKALLVSPQFLYRGLLFEGEAGKQQPVDPFELAERLSYFLWEDMPDGPLMDAAREGHLGDRSELVRQVDRMLASPKAISLSESFAYQWLNLADIDEANSDVTMRDALRSQPLDFLNYLFTENRPVMELIDSDVAFTNYLTAAFYPKDRNQLVKYEKPYGVERQLVPNQRIRLEHAVDRGGILATPGILAMNRGPILRGTWMLRNILGERLGDPPADIPAIKAALPDESLTFRQRFEQHRSDPTCARCHDRIDPLGFAMQLYDDSGANKLDPGYKPPRRKVDHDDSPEVLDASGRLPSGETFEDFEGLKHILMTSRRHDIIRNAVEQVLAYALCRKLEAFDRPTVDAITEKIDGPNGSWRDLFVEVALSLPFQETMIPLPSSDLSQAD